MGMEFTVKDVCFTSLEGNPDTFFAILPKDWSDEIKPYWNSYKDTSTIYVVKQNKAIFGGGILFNKPSPDMYDYNFDTKTKMQSWFDKGFGYFAYFYILPEYRNKGLGHFWINQLLKLHKSKGLFLSIEDKSLIAFYEKAGFKISDEIDFEGGREWVMVWG
jgi:GNAT superfamily N-acetyltransferase